MEDARRLAGVFSLASQEAASELAARTTHAEACSSFEEAMSRLCGDGRVLPELAERAVEWGLDAEIHPERDAELGFMGIDTLRSKYLLRLNDGTLMETPQFLFMRVSLSKHLDSRALTVESYRRLSTGQFAHATPTLMNAGTPRGTLASCYLMQVDDSLDSIFEGVSECAQLSKGGGGIGMNITAVRGRGSHIQGSNGASNGITPMLKVYDATMGYVDQGGGKRKGVAAIYMEPWHADIEDLVRLRDPRGDPAESLFPALWINDVFMERVRDGGAWTLFDPPDVPEFLAAHGPAFTEAYEAAERAGLGVRTIRARSLYENIIKMQLRSGTPYMHAKHACNRSSNHAHLGTIGSSNLCGEIMQYSDTTETAMCNLASVNVSAFCSPPSEGSEGGSLASPEGEGDYDFEALADCVRFIVGELEIVMDLMHYRSRRSKISNDRHRPMGIGIQGLADAFVLSGLAYDSPEACELSRRIAETMYHAALDASITLAEEKGPHPSYEGSPLSEGILHFDHYPAVVSLDWAPLRARLAEHGARHSVFLAFMPTASTSRIFGNNECFDPYHRLLYVRRTLSGEYLVASKHFLRAVQRTLGDSKDAWARFGDELNAVDGRPKLLGDTWRLFPTIWDIKRETLFDMAIARAPFVDQAESMSLYVDLNAKEPRTDLYRQQMYAWNGGLKTLSYYTHQKTRVTTNIGPKLSGVPAVRSLTLPLGSKVPFSPDSVGAVCSLDGDCLMCSS